MSDDPAPVPPPVPPVPPVPPPPTPELDTDQQWQRLDPRMLLVHPVQELLRFLPVAAGIFIAGTASGGAPWQFLGVGVPIALGLLRYLTTTFRIHAGRIELRRGLLNRHVLSTPLDRVRTVDLTASPIHRVLGLTTVKVGTGTASTRDDDRLDLDALPTARARELRTELLRVSPVDSSVDETAPDAAPGEPPPPAAPPVVAFSPSWLRFAPFTSSGLVIAAAIVGVVSQLGDNLGLFRRLDPERIADAGHPSLLLVPLAVVVLLAVVSVLAVVGYLVANWGFTLTRTRGAEGQAWHVSRGLLTTRETTLDLDRVAGVVLAEPAGLRVAGGRHLTAIVTGLTGSRQEGSLVPPAPRAVAVSAAIAVLGTDVPVTGPLVAHGPAAVRRRWTRALVPGLVVAAAAVVATVLGAPGWLLLALLAVPAAAALAADRSRALGHALTEGYVVARSGSLYRRRSALAVDHVIGWNLRSTWFQRRVGLTTLVATTAGNGGRVVLLDVPEDVAVALAQQAQPGLVAQFCT